MHRDEEKGPAAVYGNGIQEWIVNGVLHRDNGPAVIFASGDQEWWLHGTIYGSVGYFYYRVYDWITSILW